MEFVVSTPETYVEATSYVSLEQADKILSALPRSDVWVELSDENKQSLLMYASMGIDNLFQEGYINEKTDEEQELEFPRTKPNDEGIKSTNIPNKVKQATAILALQHANDHGAKGIVEHGIEKGYVKYVSPINGINTQVTHLLENYRHPKISSIYLQSVFG